MTSDFAPEIAKYPKSSPNQCAASLLPRSVSNAVCFIYLKKQRTRRSLTSAICTQQLVHTTEVVQEPYVQVHATDIIQTKNSKVT